MKVLLLGKEKSYIVDSSEKKFSCNEGTIDLTKIKLGKEIKTSTGKKFVAVKPTTIDLLRKCRRMPQIITPKDAASIVAVTGAQPGWRCLEAGTGSGFLSIFLGNIVRPGTILSYEKRKEFAENARKNIELCDLSDVVKVKYGEVKFTEKNLDLIVLDMALVEKVVSKAYKALKPGGWLCVYSPQIEQQISVIEAMKDFIQLRTIENIQRDWSSLHGYTHPKPSGITHTGFLTFGRKC